MDRKLLSPFLAIVYIAIGLLILSCGGNSGKTKNTVAKESIMVFAAASLSDVITELADSFEIVYNVDVKVNMASSGTLARQIEQGGAPEVYISASKKWADYIDSLGYLLSGSKSKIAKNDLVLISPLDCKLEVGRVDSSLDFVSLLGSERLSLGDPSHVPAGKYAKQSLSYFGWYNLLDKKLLPSKDVRSALMVVEMGEAPMGIVYLTDAQKSKRVKILGVFPENSHKPIVYVGGICKESKTAKDFFAYIQSEETLKIWSKYGFKK